MPITEIRPGSAARSVETSNLEVLPCGIRFESITPVLRFRTRTDHLRHHHSVILIYEVADQDTTGFGW